MPLSLNMNFNFTLSISLQSLVLIICWTSKQLILWCQNGFPVNLCISNFPESMALIRQPYWESRHQSIRFNLSVECGVKKNSFFNSARKSIILFLLVGLGAVHILRHQPILGFFNSPSHVSKRQQLPPAPLLLFRKIINFQSSVTLSFLVRFDFSTHFWRRQSKPINSRHIPDAFSKWQMA